MCLWPGASDGETDPNPLVRVQRDLMEHLLSLSFWKAKERYLEAERLVGVHTDLGKRVCEVVQPSTAFVSLYVTVAEHYCECHDPNYRQLNLFDLEPGSSHERLAMDWYRFYLVEIDRFLKNDVWLLTVLKSMGYHGTERGNAALVECDALITEGSSACHLCTRSAMEDWVSEFVHRLSEKKTWGS